MEGFSKQCEGVVAIDGKVLRRSFDKASGKSPLHMVSAWGCEQRLVLAQIATDAKSNEITAVPKLLEMLTLKGTIVTADALNCQRAIAQQIVDRDGDYALALKGNQDTLHPDVVPLLDDPAARPQAPRRSSRPIMAGSRRARRPSRPILPGFRKIIGGPASKPSAKWRAVREIDGKITSETAYYLLSCRSRPNASGSRPCALGHRKPATLAA